MWPVDGRSGGSGEAIYAVLVANWSIEQATAQKTLVAWFLSFSIRRTLLTAEGRPKATKEIRQLNLGRPFAPFAPLRGIQECRGRNATSLDRRVAFFTGNRKRQSFASQAF